MSKNEIIDLTEKKEIAIIVGVGRKNSDREKAFEYLDELELLADTAGAEVREKFYQELEKPNPATVVGSGKVEELKEAILEEEAGMVIFDDDLSPAQARNLENKLKVKILDRSGLILDIFAKHARTLEAKTQVELAQLQYLLPRLSGMWTHFSKQYGGIGTKGPGETQLETDRRIIKTRIANLKEKLETIAVQKEEQRKGRKNIPKFGLVGYTNAGKSTLMNAVTDAGVFVEDRLFATLDTTVRNFELPGGQEALLSDTVGFIRKLPPNLVASFRSTLAEAGYADVLVHVIDISYPQFRNQIEVVDKTLASLKLANKPQVLVFNKIDKLNLDGDDYFLMRSVELDYPDAVFISAKEKINLERMLQVFSDTYNQNSRSFKILLPYTEMEKMPQVYNIGEICRRKDIDEGIELEINVAEREISLFENSFGKYLKK